MKNFLKLFLLLSIITSYQGLLAEENTAKTEKSKAPRPASQEKIKAPDEFHKIIADYKEYAANIKPEVREEVIAFRMEMAKLNKKKRLLYRRLTADAQEYLKKEQHYKKKLPLNKKRLVTLTAPQPTDDKQ